jgi:hypothetical protein
MKMARIMANQSYTDQIGFAGRLLYLHIKRREILANFSLVRILLPDSSSHSD